MAQTKHENDKISRRDVASVPLHGSHLADSDTAFPRRWALWSQLLILQLAVIGGVFLASGAHISGGWQTLSNGHWQSVLLSLATMSLGFGGATLLYQRLAGGYSDQLEKDYRSLVARADSLLKSSLQSESAPRASRYPTAAPIGVPIADSVDLDEQDVRTARSARAAVHDAALGAASAALQSIGTAPDAERDLSLTPREKRSYLTERTGRILFEAIEQNPLLLAGVGLVVGGLIASALPESDVKDELVRRRARAAASPKTSRAAAVSATADDMSKAAYDIGQRVRRVAETVATSAFDPARNDQQTAAKTRDQ